MKTALLIGGLGLVLAALGPVMRNRKGTRLSDREYFAAARERAIAYRLSASRRAGKPSEEQ